jgi:hypothetical protein
VRNNQIQAPWRGPIQHEQHCCRTLHIPIPAAITQGPCRDGNLDLWLNIASSFASCSLAFSSALIRFVSARSSQLESIYRRLNGYKRPLTLPITQGNCTSIRRRKYSGAFAPRLHMPEIVILGADMITYRPSAADQIHTVHILVVFR